MKIILKFSTFFLRGLPLLLWMAVIFFFSSLPGSADPFEPTLLYYMKRKGAHILEYAVLMWLAVRFVRALFPSQNLAEVLFWAAVFSLLYGVSDEWHQLFTPYRVARVSDVLIDGLGILLVGFLIFLVSHIRQPKNS
jgi:VanZ family protein